MKRQAIACAWMMLALMVLFFSERGLAAAARLYAIVMPGGFTVTYYQGTDFSGSICRRSERKLVKDDGGGRPARGVSADRYAARWRGWLRVPEAGAYDLFLQVSGGGARVYLNDEMIMDHWNAPGWLHGLHGQAVLSNDLYKVRVDQYKSSERGAIRLRWTGGPIPPNTVMGTPYVSKRGPR